MNTNLAQGAQSCSAIGECRDVADGIVQGDFKKAAVKTGLFASYMAPIGGASSGAKQGYSLVGKNALAVGAAGAMQFNKQINGTSTTNSLNQADTVYASEAVGPGWRET